MQKQGNNLSHVSYVLITCFLMFHMFSYVLNLSFGEHKENHNIKTQSIPFEADFVWSITFTSEKNSEFALHM